MSVRARLPTPPAPNRPAVTWGCSGLSLASPSPCGGAPLSLKSAGSLAPPPSPAPPGGCGTRGRPGPSPRNWGTWWRTVGAPWERADAPPFRRNETNYGDTTHTAAILKGRCGPVARGDSVLYGGGGASHLRLSRGLRVGGYIVEWVPWKLP